MLLERTLRRNPELVAGAIELHQRGAIPAGTYLVDLDAIAHNASLLAAEARSFGLRTYVMTKSYGRNPFVTRIALAMGLDTTVAVEAREAYLIHRFGLPVGHVGHLGAVPLREVPRIVAMEPDVVTVFTVDTAAAISAAARDQGRDQALYVRVNRRNDEVFRGFVGGWTLEECVDGIRPILALPNVRIVGITSYPNISYSTTSTSSLAPNSTFATMVEAKERLERELGLDTLRINAPANNGCATFGLLARHGVTDVEPGHALLGGSLLHALEDLPEKPAQVYVSEVSHRWEGELYTIGSGMLYVESFGGAQTSPVRCIVGRTYREALENSATMTYRGHVDYYAVCEDVPGARPGDTALYALHPQFFVNRAYVAVASGLTSGTPRIEAIFDWACNALGPDLQPIPPAEVIEAIGRLLEARLSWPAETVDRAVQTTGGIPGGRDRPVRCQAPPLLPPDHGRFPSVSEGMTPQP
jgi:predicted amino acid racemase